MRRLTSLLIAAVMLVAALASCAAATAAAKKGLADAPNCAISPRITLTSSDASDVAEWLTARLGAAVLHRKVGEEFPAPGGHKCRLVAVRELSAALKAELDA